MKQTTDTKIEHTPGPWKHSGKYILGAQEDGSTRDPYSIAKVFPDSSPLPPYAEANARLIAAAPDLLAALQRLMRHDCMFDNAMAQRAAFDKAKAAIKKATGK